MENGTIQNHLNDSILILGDNEGIISEWAKNKFSKVFVFPIFNNQDEYLTISENLTGLNVSPVNILDIYDHIYIYDISLFSYDLYNNLKHGGTFIGADNIINYLFNDLFNIYSNGNGLSWIIKPTFI